MSAEETWVLQVLFEFSTEEEAKRYMEALSIVEPGPLFAMHIHKEID